MLLNEMRDAIKKTYEEKIRQMQEELEQNRRDQIHQMANDHRNEVQRLEGDILKLQKEKNELGETIDTIKEESKEKIDGFLQRINECKAAREALIRDHANVLRNKNREIDSLKEENGELKNTINSHTQAQKNRIHNLSSENAQLSSEKEALEVKIGSLKQTYKDGMKQLSLQISDLESLNDDLQIQIADLKNKSKEPSKQLSILKDEYLAKINELTFKKSELQNYKTLVDNFKDKIKNLVALKNQLIADKKNLVNKLEKATEETNATEKYEETRLSPHSELNEIYRKIIGEEANFDNKSEIEINWAKKKHMTLLNALTGSVIPQLDWFILEYIPEKDKTVQKFINNFKFSNLKAFGFNWNFNRLIDVSPYIEGLKQIAKSSEIDSFAICGWTMNSKQVVDAISAAKHSNRINLICWQLIIDEEVNFGDSLDGATFKTLDFEWTGRPEYSDFKSRSHRLENLLRALGKSQAVRDHLKRIWLGESGLDWKVVERMLRDANFNNCEIIGV
jgi:myosin heavy subunit